MRSKERDEDVANVCKVVLGTIRLSVSRHDCAIEVCCRAVLQTARAVFATGFATSHALLQALQPSKLWVPLLFAVLSLDLKELLMLL